MNLFIYGTLKKGFYNNDFFQYSTQLEPLYVVEKFQLYTSGIPYLVHTGNVEDTVQGELWQLDNRDKADILMLESGYDLSKVDERVYAFTKSLEFVEKFNVPLCAKNSDGHYEFTQPPPRRLYYG